jgi:CRP/FNR family transcriptional regulator, cyclic AMP receptor protein
MSIEEFLAKVPIFSALSRPQLANLAKLVQQRSFPRGTVIIRQGDTDATLYIIQSGSVKITRKNPTGTGELALATIGSGDFFGEMTLLDGSPRSATVTAIEPTDCLMLTRWVFYSTLRADPEIAVAMLPTLSQRIRNVDDTVR